MARINRRNKKKTEQIEIVPKDENPPLPPQRESDEAVPKKVIYFLKYLKYFQ